MGRRDTPGNLRLLTPQSKSCQITSEPKVYEEVKLRHNNVILPEGVGVAVALIAPLLPAQSGKSCRSNIGTPYVFIQITSTITARRFIPEPAFAWIQRKRQETIASFSVDFKGENECAHKHEQNCNQKVIWFYQLSRKVLLKLTFRALALYTLTKS